MHWIDQSQGTASIVPCRAVKHVNSKYKMMATDVILFYEFVKCKKTYTSGCICICRDGSSRVEPVLS